MNTYKIIPVNEPRGEGNGWEPCDEAVATSFEVDNGTEVIILVDTRPDAESVVRDEILRDKLMELLAPYELPEDLDEVNLCIDLINLINDERADALRQVKGSG